MSALAEIIVAEKYLRMYDAKELTDEKDVIKALSLKWFRLNALYRIKDKNGKVVRFRANSAQRQFYSNRHILDIILKARQLGMTTFKMIDSLDSCLFVDNFSAGCIAHTLEDAKDIYRNKIRFAYEKISSYWKNIFRLIGLKLPVPIADKDQGYVFDNGSSIRVSTSYRGGTLQDLHVSEFGKICRKYPDKAKEIVTGAFEAVGLDNRITIESTAEGREGYFFDYCQTAQNLADSGKSLTELDFKFHFFPWFDDPSYKLSAEGVAIPSYLTEYFDGLEANLDIELSLEQRAWYAKKAEKLLDDMKREYPSTPDEAFAQSADGAYYLKQMRFLRKNKRITTSLSYNPQYPVITAWDLGMNDAMSIWFAQVVGREIRVIDYLEDSGEGIEFYANELNKKPYNYSHHFGPHDLSVRELGANGKTRQEDFAKYGIKFEIVPRVSNQMEGINAVRQFLPECWFDEESCARGIDCLDNYRKEWDERLGVYKERPRHDWASHGAKAFETLARSDIFAVIDASNVLPQRSVKASRTTWRGFT
ncbi:MAG: terminase [Pontibacterium sp.]